MTYHDPKSSNTTTLTVRHATDPRDGRVLRRCLLEGLARGRDLHVDFAGCEGCDSATVACLVEALQQARQRGARLVLVSAPPRLLQLIALFRLDALLPVADGGAVGP